MEHEPADNPLHTGQPGTTSVVRWLIVINVAVYLLQLTVVSSADVRAQFGFATGELDAWWTVFTYMFVHAGAWHLALTMYSLWLFGSHIEAHWGPGQFAWYYVLCGLGGWLGHLLFVRQGVLIGGSAAVMGVMLAAALRWPNERMLLLGVVPLSTRALAVLLVVASLAVGVGGDAGAGYLAHLGGLVAGWAFLRMAGSMNIDRLRERVAPVADDPDDTPPRAIPPRSLPRHRGERDPRDVDEIVQQSQAAIAERTASGAQRATARMAPLGFSSVELNALLDKISAHGLDALTQTERTKLEDAARLLRGQ
jgi:membrane associated rhomboid family serine protease